MNANRAAGIVTVSLIVFAGCLCGAAARATPRLPPPLGLGHQKLSPGVHVLDLSRAPTAAAGRRICPGSRSPSPEAGPTTTVGG